MLTKPAGIFVQLLGAVAVITAIAMLASSRLALGLGAAVVGIGLLWLGRQTHPTS